MKIDAHHHIFPAQYVDALKGVGVDNTYGVGIDFPEGFSEELAALDMAATDREVPEADGGEFSIY